MGEKAMDIAWRWVTRARVPSQQCSAGSAARRPASFRRRPILIAPAVQLVDALRLRVLSVPDPTRRGCLQVGAHRRLRGNRVARLECLQDCLVLLQRRLPGAGALEA